MSLFHAMDQAVEEAVNSGLKKAFAPGGAGEDALWRAFASAIVSDRALTAVGFLWALALVFHRHGQTKASSMAYARSTLRQFLADERIKFGDPAFAWDRGAAEIVAREYEIDHWEAA